MANSYMMSNGERVLKTVIDSRVRKAKELKIQFMKDEHGYVFCEDDTDGHVCGRSSGVPLDCSHDKSVDQCQKEGKSELAWDWQNNITIRCRPHHQKYDKLV